MMNVLAKAGNGVVGTSASESATASVSASSPEPRYSPQFNATPPFSTLAAAASGGAFLRNPISPLRHPSSTVELSVERSSDRSRSGSNSPSSAAAACSRSTSVGNMASAVDNDGVMVDGGAATDVTAAVAHSRESSLETANTSCLALSESDALVMEASGEAPPAGVRVGGLVFGSGLSTPQSAWASALGGNGEDVGAAAAAGASAISA